MASDAFHRFGDDYLTREDWGNAIPPSVTRRITLALGTEPIEDARYLLPPLSLTPTKKDSLPAAEGPEAATQFVVDIFGPRPLFLRDILEALTAEIRSGLDFPRIWWRLPGTTAAQASWASLPLPTPDILAMGGPSVGGIALAWPLTGLVSQGREAVRDLAHYFDTAARAFAPLGWTPVLRETPDVAATRAARLNRIKQRFSHAVEMRLAPLGKTFPARDIWRSAYSLGLTWGEMDLFHWIDPKTQTRLFTLSGLGEPGYFLPERAAEGERVPGIALGFELPTALAPLETYDRMAVALDYLRQRLGGRPLTPTGAELDAERLYEDRDALAETVAEMTRVGVTPGSAMAERYF